MKIGYERQNEHYRHSDGSYSVWGPSKDSSSSNQGSLWLTTFVVKAFGQAAKFIHIDSRCRCYKTFFSVADFASK